MQNHGVSRPISISVSGAHGVGKTTFCNDLAGTLKSHGDGSHRVEVVTNVARDLHAKGIPINRGTEELQYPLFLEQHLTNLFAHNDSDFVIYDRIRDGQRKSRRALALFLA